MDRVFVRSQSPSKSNKKLKNIFLGKEKRLQEPRPQYFPYGGGGDDSDTLVAQFNSYEPQELMVDTKVPIEEDSLQVFKRNARKIMIRGSRYDIPENPVPPNSRSPSYASDLHVSKPPTRVSSASEGTFPLPDLASISLPSLPGEPVDAFRNFAHKSPLLTPLANLVDSVDNLGARYCILLAELWLLMLALNGASQAVGTLTKPAVWLLKVLFYFIR